MSTQSINQVKPLFCFESIIAKTRQNDDWAAIENFAVGIVKPSSVRRLGLGIYQSRSFGNGHF